MVRYVFVQQDLEKKRQALGLSQHALESQNQKVVQLRQKLQQSIDELARVRQKEANLTRSLSLQQNEVAKLKALLLESEASETQLHAEIARLQNDLNDSEQMLISKDALIDLLEANQTALQTQVGTLETNLTGMQNLMLLKDDEIAALGKKLLAQSIEHQKLVDELNITKVRIKNLTGIRIKVVQRLKERLGSSIEIDPKSGAMRFSSNVLFNQGEYRLKPGARKELKEILQRYIRTLLLDPQIRGYIEGITIEGHTDSTGDYLYNLALSQKRALEVMKYLYESDPENRTLYSRYLSASGRSYADLIYDENGREDREASRRIEIKFRIKNEKRLESWSSF